MPRATPPRPVRAQPEEDIFGTGDSERIAALVDRFCAEFLGSGIDGYEFFSSGVLSVHGMPWGSEASEDSYRGRLARHGRELLG